MLKDIITSPQILSLKQTEQKTHLSRSSIYRLMAKGEFPQNIHITANRVAWLEVDIDAWLNDRFALSRPEYGGQDANA